MDDFLLPVTSFSEVAVTGVIVTDASMTGNTGTDVVAFGVAATDGVATGKTAVACTDAGTGDFNPLDSVSTDDIVAEIGSSVLGTADTRFASTADTATGTVDADEACTCDADTIGVFSGIADKGA